MWRLPSAQMNSLSEAFMGANVTSRADEWLRRADHRGLIYENKPEHGIRVRLIVLFFIIIVVMPPS